MTLEGFENLPGIPLAEGSEIITLAQNAELVSILGDHWLDRDCLHPLWGYIGAQTGISTSIDELCRFADFSVDEGPMMGSIDLEFHGQLRPEVRYSVRGEIVDLERKQGRSGTFDLLTYRERLVDDSGEIVVLATNTFVLPRNS